MDFWDITKLLVRRWMIILPLLVLSGGLAVAAMSRVKPDYVATAYVQLVPPVAGDTKPGQPTVDQRNPWISLGLQTVGNAAIVSVTDVSVADQLHAAGLSDSYTVAMAQTSPLVTFEIVGKSPTQARQTADQLIDRFDTTLANLQTSSGVTKPDSISGHRIDVGTNIRKSTSKVKRALVAVAGAGMLVSIGSTVGIDAWLRRRQRRRVGIGRARTAASIGDSHPPSVTAAASNGVFRPQQQPVPTGNLANGGGVNGVGVPAGRPTVPANAGSDVTQPLHRNGQRLPLDAERVSETPLAVPSDATIVLPRMGDGGRSGGQGRESH